MLEDHRECGEVECFRVGKCWLMLLGFIGKHWWFKSDAAAKGCQGGKLNRSLVCVMQLHCRPVAEV